MPTQQNTNPDDFFSHLEAPLPVGDAPAPEAKRHPCHVCGGDGQYHGRRTHQAKSHCFACKGVGSFVSSYAERFKAKQARAATAKKKTDAAKDAAILDLTSREPGMVQELIDAHTNGCHSNFIWSLAQQLFEGRKLSDPQIDAWRRGQAKKAAAAKANDAAKVTVDLSALRAMFDTAAASGYKKPTYRAEGLVLKLAPMSGSNPGAIYVTAEDEDLYLGKILGMVFSPNRDGVQKGAAATLQAIAADPLEAALRYGRRTGRCACCGRELTKHASIEIGIGPICREKWGL